MTSSTSFDLGRLSETSKSLELQHISSVLTVKLLKVFYWKPTGCALIYPVASEQEGCGFHRRACVACSTSICMAFLTLNHSAKAHTLWTSLEV